MKNLLIVGGSDAHEDALREDERLSRRAAEPPPPFPGSRKNAGG